ncbi:MAG TPA: prolyl oligopeptidase family serine peptidase [Streptosporangiaceae bacterium]
MTGFSDLNVFTSMPRVTSLRLAPAGSWLAATVQSVAGDPPAYATSIWRIGTVPGAAPARLTRSAEGEAGPEFLPDGSLLFVSRRPDTASGPDRPGRRAQPADPASDEDDSGEDGPGEDSPGQAGAGPGSTGQPAVWLLPAGGGEPRRIAAPPGGIAGLATAAAAPAFACAAPVFAGATGARQDAARRKARTEAGVSAILHESGRVRYWDHDLGPDTLRLLAGEVTASPAAAGEPDRPAEPRDLTPDAGRAFDEQAFEMTPDGSAVITGWVVPRPGGEFHTELVAVDVATGKRQTLLTASDADFEDPRIAPEGGQVLAIRSGHDTYDRPGDVTLVVTGLGAGTASSGGPGGRDLLPGLDRQPASAVWAPDSRAVYFTADDQGRHPVFRVGLDGGAVTPVTTDDAAYSDLCPSPDGRYLYALRNTIDTPPAPVRIDLQPAAGTGPAAAEPLTSPAPRPEVPGRVEDVRAAAADGTEVRGWLVLPAGASASSPAPLLLWVHGGPVASWNTWSWRWNPWLMAARGYAVLLPDPALSTGYGQEMIQRGHGTWGDKPYTDVMTITDAVVARPDIDAGRTAMMGGSFGGYMANWIAGHTSRFRAIVSHAGLWTLDQMFATTDWPAFWRRTWGDPVRQPGRYEASAPCRHVTEIETPMLVIHGDKDYRVPVSNALWQWYDLKLHNADAKFLYYPDENHWILKPQASRVWYETVLAFLAQHVLGEEWQKPDLL